MPDLSLKIGDHNFKVTCQAGEEVARRARRSGRPLGLLRRSVRLRTGAVEDRALAIRGSRSAASQQRYADSSGRQRDGRVSGRLVRAAGPASLRTADPRERGVRRSGRRSMVPAHRPAGDLLG